MRRAGGLQRGGILITAVLGVGLLSGFDTPARAESDASGELLRNGGFEKPELKKEQVVAFPDLPEATEEALAWRVVGDPRRAQWVRFDNDDSDAPSANQQFVEITEHPGEKNVILEQTIHTGLDAIDDEVPTYEITFKASRPEDSATPVVSALVILLEPGTERGQQSTGVNRLDNLPQGEFTKHTFRFSLHPEARADRFIIRFVLRGGPWPGGPNLEGQQRLRLDDVRLQRIHR